MLEVSKCREIMRVSNRATTRCPQSLEATSTVKERQRGVGRRIGHSSFDSNDFLSLQRKPSVIRVVNYSDSLVVSYRSEFLIQGHLYSHNPLLHYLVTYVTEI